MSDAQRRWLGRTAFVAFCLLPTMIVLNWAMFPRSIAQWQLQARQLLGCPVEIARVATPKPNQIVLGKVRVDLGHDDAFVQFEKIDWVQLLDCDKLEVANAELTLSQFTALVLQFWNQIPQLNGGSRPIELHIPRVVVRSDLSNASAENVFAMNNCWIRIESVSSQTRLTIEFFAEEHSDAPIRWEVICREPSLPMRWSLNTNGSAIPSWLIAGAFPEILRLGNRCQVLGFSEGEWSKSLATTDVSGARLLNVDPSRIIDSAESDNAPEHDPSILLRPNTECLVLVKNARIVNRRIESAYVEVHCEGGAQIAGRFLNAAKRWLCLDLPDQPPDDLIELLQLAFAIEIREGVLSVYGQVPDGLIARGGDNQSLVYATASSQRLAPYCLAGFVADGVQVRLPVSAASLEVLSHLPLLR